MKSITVMQRAGQNRLVLTLSIVVLISLVLLGRLIYLQIVSYSDYSALATGNRLDIEPIPPVRGEIFDRNGYLLASNGVAYKLGIVPAQTDDIDFLLTELEKIVSISDFERDRFFKFLKLSNRFEIQVLKEALTDEEVGRVSVDRYRLQGVYIVPSSHRIYMGGESITHAVGRVSRIDKADLQRIDKRRYRGINHIGKYGVEFSLEEQLVGWPGYQRIETNARGRKIRTLSQVMPTAGKDIYLTLDMELQDLAYQQLGDNKGAIVALDPNTGEVLAMVSKPSYNANEFGIFSSGEVVSDIMTDADSPLLNRAIQGKYSPGSTIKPFLAFAAHEVNAHQATYFCPGWFKLPGRKRKYRCWNERGHGQVNILKAVEQSCDVFFYILARKLGIDEMYFQLSKFGFGDLTGINLADEKAGILPSREWKKYTYNEPWYSGETLITGIGQGATQVTMLQLARATAMLANGGKKFQPNLILKTIDVNSGEETYSEPNLIETMEAKSQSLEIAKESMIRVVHGSRGTARRIAEGLSYKIAGKTGTVQVIQKAADEKWNPDLVPKKFHPHGIFIAFAPVEDPKIAVAAVVENIGSGSRVAPLVRELMDAYLLKKPPREEEFASVSGG